MARNWHRSMQQFVTRFDTFSNWPINVCSEKWLTQIGATVCRQVWPIGCTSVSIRSDFRPILYFINVDNFLLRLLMSNLKDNRICNKSWHISIWNESAQFYYLLGFAHLKAGNHCLSENCELWSLCTKHPLTSKAANGLRTALVAWPSSVLSKALSFMPSIFDLLSFILSNGLQTALVHCPSATQ